MSSDVIENGFGTCFSYRLETCEEKSIHKYRVVLDNGDKSVSLPLIGSDDLRSFVSFLNDNSVQPVHVIDCYKDYVYETMIMPSVI